MMTVQQVAHVKVRIAKKLRQPVKKSGITTVMTNSQLYLLADLSTQYAGVITKEERLTRVHAYLASHHRRADNVVLPSPYRTRVNSESR